MSVATASRPRATRVALAWGVHVLTASGAVLALAALLACASGAFSRAALLMLAALLVDSVDGSLARAARVSELAPRIDGRRLDDIVDYLNYVIVPAVFLVATGSLLHPALAAVPVLASAYGFAQTEAKTEDHFFLGFPSYWNVVAIYLWGCQVSPALGSALLLLFAAAVFVPLRYLYPSRSPVLRRTTGAAAVLWLAAVTAAVARPEAPASAALLWGSLLFPAWYLGLSFWLGGLRH